MIKMEKPTTYNYNSPQIAEVEVVLEQPIMAGSGGQIDDMPYGDNNWETLDD